MVISVCVWVSVLDMCLHVHLSSVCMHASVRACVCVAEVSPESGIIADRLFLQPPRYHWIKQTCDLHFITLFILLLNWALETCRGGCWNHIYRAGLRPEAHITAALGAFCIITNPRLDWVQYISTSVMNLVSEQRKSFFENGKKLILNHFSFICIILLAVRWKHGQTWKRYLFKYYSSLFLRCSGLYCPDSCSSSCYYVILSSPVLITSWRTGPLMLISERPCVSRTD